MEGLSKYKDMFGEYPSINIFHRRNRENLYSGNAKLDFWPLKILERILEKSDYLGHVEGSEYFWGDIAKAKIKYMRLPFHTISEVNTLKVNPSMPFHDSKRPYVNYWFASSDGADCQRFNRLISDENIRRLKNENGVCLIYTHFAKGFCRKVNGKYELNREFVNLISNLVSYKNIWCPTATELLDRLLSCKSVSVDQSGYEVTVRNNGIEDILDLTLQVGSDIKLTVNTLDKNIPKTPDKIIIGKLAAGETMLLKSSRKLSGVIVKNKSAVISPRERIKIELVNYYGLLKQVITRLHNEKTH
jgi:hypothetical protein